MYCLNLYTRLDSGRSRGIMGVDDIKDGFGFDGVFVINLIIYSCFTVYMESFDCVHKIVFFGCVEQFGILTLSSYPWPNVIKQLAAHGRSRFRQCSTSNIGEIYTVLNYTGPSQ